MRFSLRILLPALLLLPALPAAANSRIGDLWSAPLAAAVGAFNSPLPGTIPTRVPRGPLHRRQRRRRCRQQRAWPKGRPQYTDIASTR